MLPLPQTSLLHHWRLIYHSSLWYIMFGYHEKNKSHGSKIQETLEIHPPIKINGKTAIRNRSSSGRAHTSLKKLQQHIRTENWTVTTQKEKEDHSCTLYPVHHPLPHCSAPYCSALRGNSPANKSPPCWERTVEMTKSKKNMKRSPLIYKKMLSSTQMQQLSKWPVPTIFISI